MLETLNADTFAPRLGDRFAVEADGGGRVELDLVEVEELGAASDGRRAPFSLVFAGAGAPTLPQRIYRLEHDELGSIDLFLVPIAADRYQAVFT